MTECGEGVGLKSLESQQKKMSGDGDGPSKWALQHKRTNTNAKGKHERRWEDAQEQSKMKQ